MPNASEVRHRCMLYTGERAWRGKGGPGLRYLNKQHSSNTAQKGGAVTQKAQRYQNTDNVKSAPATT